MAITSLSFYEGPELSFSYLPMPSTFAANNFASTVSARLTPILNLAF